MPHKPHHDLTMSVQCDNYHAQAPTRHPQHQLAPDTVTPPIRIRHEELQFETQLVDSLRNENRT